MRTFQASVRELDKNWLLTDLITARSRRQAERIAYRMYHPSCFTRAEIAVRPVRPDAERRIRPAVPGSSGMPIAAAPGNADRHKRGRSLSRGILAT